MKVLIAKNDKFETVGFYVIGINNQRFFRWGVYPDRNFYFVKETDVTKETEDVISELITLQGKVSAFHSIEMDFFHCVSKEQVECLEKKHLEGFNLTHLTDQRNEWQNKIDGIVKNF